MLRAVFAWRSMCGMRRFDGGLGVGGIPKAAARADEGEVMVLQEACALGISRAFGVHGGFLNHRRLSHFR